MHCVKWEHRKIISAIDKRTRMDETKNTSNDRNSVTTAATKKKL